MNAEQKQVLQAHIKAIAQILYDDTPREELTTLSGIEQAVRRQMQKHVMPEGEHPTLAKVLNQEEFREPLR